MSSFWSDTLLLSNKAETIHAQAAFLAPPFLNEDSFRRESVEIPAVSDWAFAVAASALVVFFGAAAYIVLRYLLP